MSGDSSDDGAEPGRRDVLQRGRRWSDGDQPGTSGRRTTLKRAAMELVVAASSLFAVGTVEASWTEYKCVDSGCRTYYPCTQYKRVCWPSGCDDWQWDGCCDSC